MKAAAVISALAASPAVALAPPWAVCDNADGTTSEFMTTYGEDSVMPGMTYFEVHDAARDNEKAIEVIAHCASGKAISFKRDADFRNIDRIWDLIEGDRQFTLRQLSREIKQMGLETTYGRLDSGNCACNPATYRNSF